MCNEENGHISLCMLTQNTNFTFWIQVKTAETSLTKLARPGQEEDSAAFAPMDSSSSELEAALASLHLRDLRCQQLSLEITKVYYPPEI